MKRFYVHFFVTVMLMLISIRGNCQFDKAASNILPSANATSLVAQANTQVNLFNGQPLVQASLNVVKARGGYDVPIALSYKTGGVKVQDIAGIVGIGWSISTNCQGKRIKN